MTTGDKAKTPDSTVVEPPTDGLAQFAAAQEDDGKKVEVTIANYLDPWYATRVGLEDKQYAPGDKVKVTPAYAESLRSSGYATPADK